MMHRQLNELYGIASHAQSCLFICAARHSCIKDSLREAKPTFRGRSVASTFFLAANTATADLRMKIANACLEDMVRWLASGGQVGILDGSNTTEERRQALVDRFKSVGVNCMFIESICDNPEIIDSNILSVKVSSPDYVGWKDTDAVNDFNRRIQNHVPFYKTITDLNQSFVKLVNVGEKIVVNNVQGFLQSKIVYYLMNLHICPRKIYFARNGVSLSEQSYKADAPLAPAGHRYAENLKNFLLTLRENQALAIQQANSEETLRPLTVWTSSRQRSFQTAAHFLDHEDIIVRNRTVLAERNPGICDQMTPEEIQEKYPDECLRAKSDPYRHRFPRAESFYDLANRLEKVILELEREKNDVLIITHESVIKCLYGYLFGLPERDIPSLEIPENTLLELVPTAYTTEETRHVIPHSLVSVNWQLQADTLLSLAGKIPASPMFMDHYLPDEESTRTKQDSLMLPSPWLSSVTMPVASQQDGVGQEPESTFRL
ncbi:hypothetical protein BGZ65_001980 [Modicella reniformis]|uniref:6-phosphofructo-2-kinase domain-containing protein n=1 Tax=Modicella reniformis TaxID=1440133 RepID=A0A9P6SQI0_9FUNG|nr:hypothetical protein BGZ65_001980 [Modicella reniformis]